MAESATENVSTALYQYVCQNIVGSEEHVKTIRMMNNVRDDLQSLTKHTLITSGSFGEGLTMRGSDLDIMLVLKVSEVSEDTPIYFNAGKIYLTMETEDSQTGFTKLRLVHCEYQEILNDCEEIGSNLYYLNSCKQKISNPTFPTEHGPCISHKRGVMDFAFCLHSKLWITPAKQWITRSNNSWPSNDVKPSIVKHGVLFVPVGVKGSTKEELELRISFSVGEKLLIHTFTHTQLLCYALFKILLKDVIASNIDCKELLCSYFMKTVLFWVNEELPPSIWKPRNLISCYMRCFKRLIYCVKYTVCPHYFIPEINLFEKKIQGQAQETLLNQLYILNSYGWQCILFSDQLSNFNAFAFDINNGLRYLHLTNVEQLLTSTMLLETDFWKNVIYKILSSESSKVQYLCTFYMSKYCCKRKLLLPFEDMSGNKSTYKQYSACVCTMLLKTRHDAVSGWLMLASFFYRRKQYNTALYIIQYSLSKCTPEKIPKLTHLSDNYRHLFNLHLFRKMTIFQLLRFYQLDLVVFTKNSELVPDELETEIPCTTPPVVYAHFLRFLCHYHLQNSSQYWDSIRDLQWTIEDNYFIGNFVSKAKSYSVLGICLQMLGDLESARQSFMQSIELHPDDRHNRAFQKLYLIN